MALSLRARRPAQLQALTAPTLHSAPSMSPPPRHAGFQAYLSGDWAEARRRLEECRRFRRNRCVLKGL